MFRYFPGCHYLLCLKRKEKYIFLWLLLCFPQGTAHFFNNFQFLDPSYSTPNLSFSTKPLFRFVERKDGCLGQEFFWFFLTKH